MSAFANLEILLRTSPGSPTVSSSSISVFKFYLRLQSWNSIFDFNLQILSSTSIFKFYLQLQSSNSIFDFNLRASCARLSFQVNKTCWKSPKLNRRILAFFLKKWVWRADFERFLKKLFLTCKISQKRTQLRVFNAFSIGKM